MNIFLNCKRLRLKFLLQRLIKPKTPFIKYLKNILKTQTPPFQVALMLCACEIKTILTATHAVTAVQTFVTGAAAYGDVSAGVTGGCIALHAFSCSIYSVHTGSIYFG